MTKVLIGVDHANEDEEIEALKSELALYNFSKVGLELPEDYLERQKVGIEPFFFRILVSYFNSLGTQILPLEDKKLYYRQHTLIVTKAILTGQLNKQDIEIKLKDDLKYLKENCHLAPELLMGRIHFGEINAQALRLLEGNTNLEQLLILIEDNKRKREAHALRVISREVPEIIIVGGDHARRLHPDLTDFIYRDLTDDKRIPKFINI